MPILAGTVTDQRLIDLLLHFDPSGLSHKPVVLMPYAPFDGGYSGDTDAKFISIGLPTWDWDDGLSVKIFRHTGNRWSRESEEVPLHRSIDTTKLVALFAYNEPGAPLDVPAGTFTNQDMPLTLAVQHKMEAPPTELLDDTRAQLRSLRDLLNRLDPP